MSDQQQPNNQQQNQRKQIQIKANEEALKGRYANLAMINHTKEEFVVDFLNVLPPTGVLASRIFISPGHAKRLSMALVENVKKYEEKFGKIEAAKENDDQKIGFM
jgi:hypothetical protein